MDSAAGGARVTKGFDPKRVLFWGAVSVVVSGLCLFFILRWTENKHFLGGIFQVGLKTLCLAGGLVVASWLADGLRMLVLAKAMGGNLSAAEAVRISVMGSFMAGVTPFDTGGEPLKVFFLHKRGMGIGQATAAVALAAVFHATTRFLLWAMLPLAAFAFGFQWKMGPGMKVTLCIGLFFYVSLMAFLFLAALLPNWVSGAAQWLCKRKIVKRVVSPEFIDKLVGRVESAAREFRTGIVAFRSKRTSALIALFLSTLYWAFVITVPVLILRGMGSGLSLLQIVPLSMTVYLVMACMPTPGASGGAEVGSALFFSPFLPGKILGTFVVVWRLVTYYFTLLVGGGLIAAETLSWSLRKTNLQSR